MAHKSRLFRYTCSILNIFILNTFIKSTTQTENNSDENYDFNGVDKAYLERLELRANRTGGNYKYVKIGDHGGIFIQTDSAGNELTYGIHENELQLVQVSTDSDDDTRSEYAVFEGDMLIPISENGLEDIDKKRGALNAISQPQKKWPKDAKTGLVEVPYTFGDAYNQTSVKTMTDGMKAISKFTCVTPVPRSNQDNYIKIINMTTCASMVGMHRGKNDIFLNEPRCMSKGVVTHEFLHAIGFQHEQSRSDRDDYVDVIYSNIMKTGNFRLNFNRHKGTTNYVIYDYYSIMHYPPISWSRKPYLQTIVPKKYPIPEIGQRARMSPYDIEEVKMLYRLWERGELGGCFKSSSPIQQFSNILRTL